LVGEGRWHRLGQENAFIPTQYFSFITDQTRDDTYLEVAQSDSSPTELEAAMLVKHLNQIDLARRWKVSPRSLERWRWEGGGPAYLKVGGRVLYRLEDIEAHEKARLRQSTANVVRELGMAR
jgi:hypothetical protein